MKRWLASLAGGRARAVTPAEAAPVRELPRDHAVVAERFDAAFYLAQNPDVAAAGVDALEHFMAHGWREGRDPHPQFSLRAYLSAHPEVERAGLNPYLHFLESGEATKPASGSPYGFRYEVIERLAPLEARLAAAAAPVKVQDVRALAEALRRSRSLGLERLHVTFSHDDYSANLGGVQLALQREAAGVAQLGRDHLHIHPARAWQVVRTKKEAGQLGVLWNGRSLGAFEPSAVVQALREACSGPSGGRSFAIHSMLGQATDETVEILAAAGLKAGYFWLHDFASLCAGFHLLRNDVEDCAAPPPDSAACSICVYGPWRGRHLAAHERLFRRLKLTVVAPSRPTLDLWRASWDFPAAGAIVHPHLRMTPRGPAPAPADGAPFRLAYAGLPVTHKGWRVFRELAAQFGDDPRYAFVHLGARRAAEFGGDFREVVAGPQRPRAMQQALEAERPDAVLVWPLCRETFSFVAHEAAAAGCAVITNPDSGNVAAFVAEAEAGLVLDHEAALADAFDTGAILDLGRARRRPMLQDLVYGSLTADLLKEAASA
jgi:hypothetical protein